MLRPASAGRPVLQPALPSRGARVHWRALLIAATAMAAGAPASAQVDPAATYRTLTTAHFRVTYQADLEPLARHTAARAEVAWAALARTLTRPPGLPIDIVITDDHDLSNGMATAIPWNRIRIHAKPPVETMALAYNDDWIDLVVTHELAHIFHLDAHGPVGRALRAVFGRVPFTWPVFPAVGTPRWSLEGLAVQVESALTGFGRIHGTWHEAVVRTAVLAGRPDPIDRVNGSTPIWPGDERVYIYGSLFLDRVTRTYSDSMPAMLVNDVARAWLPPSLFFNRIPRRVTGSTFTDLYRAWMDTLRVEYNALADSLRAYGLTEAAPLTAHGYRSRHPRYAPDSRSVAYAAADGRTVAQTRIITADDGRTLRATRRNTLASLAWLPDGDLVTSQLEWHDRSRLRSDLYRIDAQGREHRLTYGERLQDPDAARDGRRIVAIANDAGGTGVVLLDYYAGRVTSQRTIVPSAADVQWALPRFSPDGATIAASRSSHGVYQVVLLDTIGNLIREVTHGAALDMGATFSPDARWLVFSSDRSGIANLYAVDLHDTHAPLRQITNVLGGAYEPDVAPDGSAIAFSEYRHDGFHIVRIPFDPVAWRVAPPAILEPAARPLRLVDSDMSRDTGAQPQLDATMYDTVVVAEDTTVHADHGYSAWRTLRPYYWLPIAYAYEDVGTFIGAASSGSDVIGRHYWSASAAVDPEHGRTAGALTWSWAAWRNPRLDAGASRDWDRIGFVRLPDDSTEIRAVLEREDIASASLGFVRQRTRNSMSARVGGELVRRSRTIENGAGARLLSPHDNLAGIVTSFGFATSRMQPFSISREDGVSLALTARRRWDRSPGAHDAAYSEITTHNTLYQAVDLPGFAHHVIGLRASGLYRSGNGATPSSIGGASGILIAAPLDLGVGPGSLLLPIRGYPRGARTGTSAWTASAEYRFPLAVVGRGIRVLPLFLDRVSGAVFADAGDAWCSSDVALRYTHCVRTEPGAPLVAAGAELNLDLGIFGYGSLRTRVGGAMPLRGAEHEPALYLRFGHAF